MWVPETPPKMYQMALSKISQVHVIAVQLDLLFIFYSNMKSLGQKDKLRQCLN